ncbi:unnamed protein product [Penicillium salamii]|uniref:Uncharacterized protein n=1 Tax=Penicillium salamii TaxID=1612424 RepID=A0A9W4JT15_9EURO|nr:unnamed protein product [Penicillium salamii]CAG8291990.1 unnamed protein product [Penicillium salamii]CAG8368254.1 unnamed protein product [Penicillium salamii]CAG8377078.1 unnamed protein product [Penicillium salamii]CAG8379072.1 unnamed protein product [Penicillium salamii]
MESEYHSLNYTHDSDNYIIGRNLPEYSTGEADPIQQNSQSRPTSATPPGFSPKNPDQPIRLSAEESQTTLAQQEKKRTCWSLKNSDISGSWIWEILGAIFSVVCIGLLVGFLFYVNMTYAKWQYSISPNSVISVISAFAKASMLIPVTACLGQLKWSRDSEQRPRPLFHIHALDQASRGPWGALGIFWTIKSGLTMAAAALVILSVGIDPFMQQILTFPSRKVLAGNETAYIQTAENYQPAWSDDEPGTSIISEQSSLLDPKMQVAVLTGLAKTNTPLRPICSSGSCRYPEFSTLGICSGCEDVTELALQTCTPFIDHPNYSALVDPFTEAPGNCSYKAPSGLEITPISIAANMYVDEFLDIWCPSLSSVSKEVDGQLLTVLTARYNHQSTWTPKNLSAFEPKPILTQCSISFCEKEFASSHVSTESYSLKLVRSQNLKVPEAELEASTSRRITLDLIPVDGAKTFDNASYRVEFDTHSNIRAYLRALFNTGLSSPDHDIFLDTSEANGESSSGVGIAAILYSNNNISDSLQHMDESMTDTIRTNSSNTRVGGDAYRTETYVKVHWPWIIFPIALPFFATILLVVVVLENRDQDVLWKSSVFPLLMSELKLVEEHDISYLRNLDQVETLSKKIKVRQGEENGSSVLNEY